MKWIFSIAVTAIVAFTACNSDSSKSPIETKMNKDTIQANTVETKKAPTNEVVNYYFQMKNALADDNGKDAASAGKAIVEALSKLDTTAFTIDQKKVYTDMEDDIRENAEHIGDNAEKIAHQREHFEMLSKDIYELVKKFGAGQTVYQDFCPMYNNKKGATWISETREIKNPYLGKEMPTCGTVKEEIK
jgi:Protein of unknown function (DUF3347)